MSISCLAMRGDKHLLGDEERTPAERPQFAFCCSQRRGVGPQTRWGYFAIKISKGDGGSERANDAYLLLTRLIGRQSNIFKKA